MRFFEKPHLYIKHIFWISWSIANTSTNMFLLMVFGFHLLRAMVSQYENKLNLPLLNHHSTFNILKYEEGIECFNILILLLWQKLSNFLIAQKTNMRTNMERPKSMELFGLCGLFTTMSVLIGLICASMCVQVHCLYLIGW